LFYVDLQEVFDFEELYDREAVRLSDGIRRGVERGIDEAVREAINTRRYQDQTGLLTSMIKGFVEVSTPGGAVGYFGAFTDYASYVEGGTRPHQIHGNPMLVFKGRDGTWVRTTMVNHPGTQADGFMGRAFLKAERVILREVEISVEQLRRALTGG
jgi:hypothetical protein